MTTIPPTPADVRATLRQLAVRHKVSLAELSRVVGRNPAYIHQFLAKGSPERLPEDERLALAMFFGVDERVLGAREPWAPDRHPRLDQSSPRS